MTSRRKYVVRLIIREIGGVPETTIVILLLSLLGVSGAKACDFDRGS